MGRDCDGLKFPKKTGKKRKKHRKSILHCRDGTCYLCMKLLGDLRRHGVLHEHHVYGGVNRAVSEANGFKVYLCVGHHVSGPDAVHNNQKHMRLIQKDCQRKYEENHTRQQFMDLIKRNYLED